MVISTYDRSCLVWAALGHERKKTKGQQIICKTLHKKLKIAFHYIDDVLSINNSKFGDFCWSHLSHWVWNKGYHRYSSVCFISWPTIVNFPFIWSNMNIPATPAHGINIYSFSIGYLKCSDSVVFLCVTFYWYDIPELVVLSWFPS